MAQIQEAAKAHREVKNRGKDHDFLSGFHSTDKLIPVAEKARITTLADTINKLKNTMGWTSEKTMEILNLSENDRQATAPFL